MSTPTTTPETNNLTQKVSNLPWWVKALAFALAIILAYLLLAPKPEQNPENASEAITGPTGATTTTQPVTPGATTDAPAAPDDCATADEADMTDPDDVATYYGLIAYCIDSAQDPNMTAAALRAEPLMTTRLLDITREAASIRSGAGAQFANAAAQSAQSVPTVQIVGTHGVELHDRAQDESAEAEEHENEIPAELANMQTRTISVSWQWATAEGTYLPGGRNVLDLILLPQEDGTYKVDAAAVTYAEGM